MPVDRRALGQVVRHIDANPLAARHLQDRARRAPVITPDVEHEAGRDLPGDRLGHEVKDPHPTDAAALIDGPVWGVEHLAWTRAAGGGAGLREPRLED